MSGVLQRASNASKQILANPHLKQAVEQATEAGNRARDVVSSNYTDLMKKNAHYVLGDKASSDVTKHNVLRFALFTSLAECAFHVSTPVRCLATSADPALCLATPTPLIALILEGKM
jgi:hypothetical protein